MSRGNSRSHNNSWIGYCRLSRTMITGYKKKKLGRPSEKLSGDVPRAKWRAVIVSEIIFPMFMAVLFTIAYMFVKSFPQQDNRTPPSPLIRLAVVSIGPLVLNAAILLVLFMISLTLGPMLDSCCTRFGSVMASIAHIGGTLGMIGFFEFFVGFLIRCTFFSDLDSFSGSLSHGIRRTLCWVSSPSSPFSVPSTRYSFQSSSPESSSTMRPTVLGGPESGMAVDSAPTPFHNPHASLSSRLSNCHCGAPTSSSDTSFFSCSRPQH